MSKTTRFLILFVLLILVVDAALIVPIMLSQPSKTAGLELVEEAWQVVINDYVDKDKLDLKELSDGAIKGMLDALGDPYAGYFSAEEYKIIKQFNIEGSYGGIGTVVTIDEGQILVVAPIEGTPAKEAGIKPRDRILEINGESTEGMILEQAALKIQGEPGTQVTLKIVHKGEEEPVTLVITREKINVDSVYKEVLQDTPMPTTIPSPTISPISDNIAQIRVTYFSKRTGDEITSALKDVIAGGAVGIILDLRDNPGGTLNAAVTVASQFLAEGIVISAVDGNGEKQSLSVEKGGLALDIPLVVLVNSNSASASEVVAGALQDYERGVIIGTQTFGKGSLNHFRELSDGSAIYISIGRWFTPDGRQIEGHGLTPDIIIDRTEDDIAQGKDPQLDKAVEYLKSQL
ncbi:MAG TPA: S41 family peptidase [Dehalococcoidia bacterium]|nr:S41 family peptidase [Dehalococcoidia bacterium]